jgi:hypothetical protein
VFYLTYIKKDTKPSLSVTKYRVFLDIFVPLSRVFISKNALKHMLFNFMVLKKAYPNKYERQKLSSQSH